MKKRNKTAIVCVLLSILLVSIMLVLSACGTVTETDTEQNADDTVGTGTIPENEPVEVLPEPEEAIPEEANAETKKTLGELSLELIVCCGFSEYYSELTALQVFTMAYIFGDFDGSLALHDGKYPLSYIEELIKKHMAYGETVLRFFNPEELDFYDKETQLFASDGGFGGDGLFKVDNFFGNSFMITYYRGSSAEDMTDGNIERIYNYSYTVEKDGTWRLDNMTESLDNSSSDIDEHGRELFDGLMGSMTDDSLKTYEYYGMYYADTGSSFKKELLFIVDPATEHYMAFQPIRNDGGGIMSMESLDEADTELYLGQYRDMLAKKAS